jgi:hypothetical protein
MGERNLQLFPDIHFVFATFVKSTLWFLCPRAAVLNLWSMDPWGFVMPSHGVCDCLGQQISHVLVAFVFEHTTYMF